MPDHENHQTFEEGIALVAALKECARQKDVHNGSKSHASILKRDLLTSNVFIGSALVNMYAKWGALAKAQQMFDELPTPNVVSWNALITGYTQHGHCEKALNCFGQMREKGVSPNAVTCTSILKACSGAGLMEKGKELHDEIVEKEFFGEKVVLGTALVDMYSKCGDLSKAQQMFDELPVGDAVAWSALIAGYAQHGQGRTALECYRRMQSEGLSPNAATFSCILKACGSMGALEEGKDIFEEVVRRGLLGNNLIIGNAVVDMFARCGALVQAQEVFDKLPCRDVVSWTTVMSGYCQHGYGEEALRCFEHMGLEGVSPNAITFLSSLQACGSVGDAEKGQDVHAEIARKGLAVSYGVLGNALVDMYAKCSELMKAREIFDTLLLRDKISWTALITAYCQHRYCEEALKCFGRMQDEGVKADATTLACVLQACGSVGATEKGRAIHAKITRSGSLIFDNVLGTALLDFYANCGELAMAQKVFDELREPTVVSWNAIIGGYAQDGKVGAVFDLLNRMKREGSPPDMVTFVVVLNACSCLGLVNIGQTYMETMRTHYCIVPTLEHHTCMVGLLGHAGHFDKAMAVIKNMPSSDYLPVWFALLGACRKWGNVKLGRFSFEHAIRLNKRSALAYACMRDIYADAGMDEDAHRIEAMKRTLYPRVMEEE